MDSQPVVKILREILSGHGIVMSCRHGPIGPADVERKVLAGTTKEAAVNSLIKRIIHE